MQHCEEHNTVQIWNYFHCSCDDSSLGTLIIFFSKRDPREIQRTAYFEWQPQILVRLKYKLKMLYPWFWVPWRAEVIFQLHLLLVRYNSFWLKIIQFSFNTFISFSSPHISISTITSFHLKILVLVNLRALTRTSDVVVQLLPDNSLCPSSLPDIQKSPENGHYKCLNKWPL